MVLRLFILNRSGGLIHSYGAKDLATNAQLVLGATFHSLYLLAAEVSPAPGSAGLSHMVADDFNLWCFAAPSGVKFVLVVGGTGAGGGRWAAPDAVRSLLGALYKTYADYVAKDAFYEREMPIRSPKFDAEVSRLLE